MIEKLVLNVPRSVPVHMSCTLKADLDGRPGTFAKSKVFVAVVFVLIMKMCVPLDDAPA